MLHMSRYEEAETLLKDALRIRREMLGEYHREVGVTKNNLPLLAEYLGNYQEALRLYEEALDIVTKAYPDDHIDIAAAMNNVANILEQTGEVDRAKAMHEKALEMRRSLLGPNNLQVARSLNNIAWLQKNKGELDNAEGNLWEVVRIAGTIETNHPYIVIAMTHIADIKAKKIEHRDCHEVAEQALDIVAARYETDFWRTAYARSTLAQCLVGLREFATAEPVLIESYETLRSLMGKEAEYTQIALERILKLYEAWSRPERAAEFLERP